MGQVVPRDDCPACGGSTNSRDLCFDGGNTLCPGCGLIFHYCPTSPPTLTKKGSGPAFCDTCRKVGVESDITCGGCGERGNGEKFKFEYNSKNEVTCLRCNKMFERGGEKGG